MQDKMRILFFSILLLMPWLLSAQFGKGTIRLPDGQEVSGYIQQDGYVQLQDRLYFKASPEQSEAQLYRPKDLIGFRFDEGDEFHQILISYEENGLLLSKPQFAQVLALGTIDLYRFTEGLRSGRFVLYARKEGQLHKLSEDPILLSSGSYTVRNAYQGVLKVLLFDCKELTNVAATPFREKAITDLINTYNRCQDGAYQPLVTNNKAEKQKVFYVEALSGVSTGQVETASSMQEGDLVAIWQVGLALQMENVNHRISRKLRTQYSLGLYKWIDNGDKRTLFGEFLPSMSLSTNVSAHYIFNPLAKARIYSRLGVAVNFDFGAQLPLRPGVSLGLGVYLPSDMRLGLRYESLGIVTGKTAWQAAVAVPFSKQ